MNQERQAVLNAMLCMTRQCWEQGIVAQALMELGETDRLALVVHDIVLRQSADGRLCNVEGTPAVTDSSFCIPAVYEYGSLAKREDCIEAARKNTGFLLNEAQRAEDGTLYHMLNTQQVWADSAAFLPYALAKLGYVEEAYEQMQGICKRLYDPSTGLYFHKWDDETQSFLRPCVWGIGNGWILTGMLRLYLETRGKYHRESELLYKQMKTLLDTILSYQAETGLFCDILDDADSFQESECSEMVAYVIYRGVKEGVFESSYLKTAERIRGAIEKRVTKQGLIISASSSPDFMIPGTSVESQAHYLMMEYWAEKLLGADKEKWE